VEEVSSREAGLGGRIVQQAGVLVQLAHLLAQGSYRGKRRAGHVTAVVATDALLLQDNRDGKRCQQQRKEVGCSQKKGVSGCPFLQELRLIRGDLLRSLLSSSAR
jgi:hypothetical protein